MVRDQERARMLDAYRRFADWLGPAGAAGLIGNYMAESRLNANLSGDNGTAKGWAQWRGPRYQGLLNYAAQRGLDWRSDEANAGYTRHEMETQYPGLVRQLRAAQSPQQAAELVALHYERPKGAETGNAANIMHIDRRVNYANLAHSLGTGAPMAAGYQANYQAPVPGTMQAARMGDRLSMPGYSADVAPGAPNAGTMMAGGPRDSGLGGLLAGLAGAFGGAGQAQEAPAPQAPAPVDYSGKLASLAQQPGTTFKLPQFGRLEGIDPAAAVLRQPYRVPRQQPQQQDDSELAMLLSGMA